jgi:hypothetical protein
MMCSAGPSAHPTIKIFNAARTTGNAILFANITRARLASLAGSELSGLKFYVQQRKFRRFSPAD